LEGQLGEPGNETELDAEMGRLVLKSLGLTR
jgi:hypothetical protein